MKNILGPTVSTISHSPHSFEVDPVRLADPFYLKANTINLSEICSNVLQKVLKMDTLDLEIKAMLERIRIITESKFPKHGRLAVTTVFFLRCFLPTFISPQIYGVNLPEGEKEVEQTRRALLLISKTLQSLVNNVAFVEEHSYMHVLNGFISANAKNIQTIADNISNKQTVKLNPLRKLTKVLSSEKISLSSPEKECPKEEIYRSFGDEELLVWENPLKSLRKQRMLKDYLKDGKKTEKQNEYLRKSEGILHQEFSFLEEELTESKSAETAALHNSHVQVPSLQLAHLKLSNELSEGRKKRFSFRKKTVGDCSNLRAAFLSLYSQTEDEFVLNTSRIAAEAERACTPKADSEDAEEIEEPLSSARQSRMQMNHFMNGKKKIHILLKLCSRLYSYSHSLKEMIVHQVQQRAGNIQAMLRIVRFLKRLSELRFSLDSPNTKPKNSEELKGLSQMKLPKKEKISL